MPSPSIEPVHDLKALQAFVHPLRSRLLGLLREHGPATATDLARMVDESTGSTSYHLRQLARFGFIEDDPEQPLGRARRWRAATDMTRIPAADFIGDPVGRAALGQVVRNQLDDWSAAYGAFVASEPPWGPDWLDAAMSADMTLRLTSDGLRALKDEMQAVLLRYLSADQQAPGAERVFLYLGAVPTREGTAP